MTIQKMKQTTFKEATLTEWEQVAIKSLKGKITRITFHENFRRNYFETALFISRYGKYT